MWTNPTKIAPNSFPPTEPITLRSSLFTLLSLPSLQLFLSSSLPLLTLLCSHTHFLCNRKESMKGTYFVIKCLENWYTEYEFCLKICIHFHFFCNMQIGRQWEREKERKRRHKNLFHSSFTPNGMKGNVPLLPHNIFSRPNIHSTFSLCSSSTKCVIWRFQNEETKKNLGMHIRWVRLRR